MAPMQAVGITQVQAVAQTQKQAQAQMQHLVQNVFTPIPFAFAFPEEMEPKRRPRQPVLPDIGKIYRERVFDVGDIFKAIFK